MTFFPSSKDGQTSGSISVHIKPRNVAMASSRKSQQEKTACAAPETPMVWRLPADVLLEIVARFDLRTLVRCAATCKLLRRDLLSPAFIHSASQAAPCILAYLCIDTQKPLLTLVHPTTAVAASFCNDHLSRFLSRRVAGTLLEKYKPVSSRRGLVVLQRQNIKNRQKSGRCFNLCVYNPMSGAHKFFSNPPEIRTDRAIRHKFVLLTAADGIGYSFLLLVFELCGSNIRVHAASPCGTWGPISDHDFRGYSLKKRGDPAILSGGVIHWLVCPSEKILSYDFGTGKMGSVKLPSTNYDVNYNANNLHLVTSSDKKLLKLLAIQGFMMHVWLQLPVSSADSSGWSLETVIDMKEKLQSLDPNIIGGPNEHIEFEGSGKSNGDVVLLDVVHNRDHGDTLVVFDLETRKMHMQKREFSLLEIDLPSRLQTMKIFPN